MQCLEHGADCAGPVEHRMPLSGTGRAFPRCDFHWEKRLDAQERTAALRGATPPAWFDPAYAGERWSEDD